ncbi:MAG: DNA-3-methyladenine glycosylase I [Planctomycetaceae bacterium]|jgi:DNA-3-methyladenine glycosylase I|nr:DNA-3-methyladenine glycosylase I [Planctomycetaceae bacterium]
MSPNQGSNADLASNTDLGINTDLDGRPRCWWCGNDPLYVRYHDTEWGLPVRNDQRIYEKICLEGFQAGLSWITILRKREAFRQRFANFDFTKVAHFNPQQVAKLVTDAAIIRHRKKIESAINNAQRAIEMVDTEGSITDFVWQFQPRRSVIRKTKEQIPALTDESTALSKELKRRGWSFVGPTTCYAMMQSLGMVNDHLRSCQWWETVEQKRKMLP